MLDEETIKEMLKNAYKSIDKHTIGTASHTYAIAEAKTLEKVLEITDG